NRRDRRYPDPGQVAGPAALVPPLAPAEPLPELGLEARHQEVLDEDRSPRQLDPVDDPERTPLDDAEPVLGLPLLQPQPGGPEQGLLPVGTDPPADVPGVPPEPVRGLEETPRGGRPWRPLEQPGEPPVAAQPREHGRRRLGSRHECVVLPEPAAR